MSPSLACPAGTYRYLEQHQQMLDEVMIVTYALRKAIFELGPEAAKVYAKHYLAESQGPIKIAGDEARQSLARLIERLGAVH